MEDEPAVSPLDEHPVGSEHVEVGIETNGATEYLDERQCAGPAVVDARHAAAVTLPGEDARRLRMINVTNTSDLCPVRPSHRPPWATYGGKRATEPPTASAVV